MKNFLKLSIVTVSLLCTFCSCENDENNSIKENVEFSKIDFSNLKLEIDFNKIEPIKKNFPENIKNKEIESILISDIQNLNSEIEFRINNDKETSFIEYSITINKDFYVINNWNFIPSNSNIAAKGGPYEDIGWKCPNGQTLVNVCWSESCVKEALASALSDISSGDTVNLTVHHGGALGGVSICSN
jgi:hypothetical protein